jgi:Mn2+/Fe2+ NRAMP family transporter
MATKSNNASASAAPAAPPRTFREYVSSFGPGIVVVLTWLGAGDIVEMGVAGGNFGYALMWVVVVALVMRFLFVSLIAKYQLCNERGEGVVDGLARLHAAYPLLLGIAAVVMGHIYGAYFTVGIGEACANVTGIGQRWQWAILFNGIALALVFRPAFGRIETLFKWLLALLSVSLIGTALWVGPNLRGILEGTFAFKLPPPSGDYHPLLIATAMIGAVGGSLMNLVYPYFLEAKGWKGPQFRRVQLYDFLLAVVVMIVLDLAIWTLGAELLYPRGLTVKEMDDLPRLLSEVLGQGGRVLFYLGIFAAIYTSIIGHALGLGCLGSHSFLRWRHGVDARLPDYRTHWLYRWIAIWCLVSPLVWTAPGMPGFVFLTVVSNSAQVVLVPPIAGGLWWITASGRFIGKKYKNRWWENGVMLALCAIAVWWAYGAVRSVYEAIAKALSQ